MKNTYKLLSDECAPQCPAVLLKGDEIVVIGTLLSPEEENVMKQKAKVGIAPHERTVSIPRAVFEAAVDRFLTAKADK